MKKKLIILFSFISVACLIFIVAVVLQHSKNNPTTSPSPSPTNQFNSGTNGTNPELPNDAKYGQAITNLVKQYPWYPKLPIETKDYRIVYDFDKNMFRIRILSTTATGDEIKSLIQNALNDLKNIGVPAPIKYYVLDINGNQL